MDRHIVKEYVEFFQPLMSKGEWLVFNRSSTYAGEYIGAVLYNREDGYLFFPDKNYTKREVGREFEGWPAEWMVELGQFMLECEKGKKKTPA